MGLGGMILLLVSMGGRGCRVKYRGMFTNSVFRTSHKCCELLKNKEIEK
jgi:hypothetical protein